MAIIIRLLMLVALCAPFNSVTAQTQSPPANVAATSWDGWVPYHPGNLTEVDPRVIVNSLHDQLQRLFSDGRIPRPTSQALRTVYSSPENLRQAIARRHPIFSAERAVPMAHFTGLIGTRNGQIGFYVPVEPAAVPRAASAPRAPAAAPPVDVTALQRRVDELARQLQQLQQQQQRSSADPVRNDRVTALEQMLGTVTTSLGALTRIQEEYQRASGQRIDQLSATVASQHAILQAAVAELAQQLAVEPRQVTVERFVLPSWLGWVLAAIAVLALGALVVALRARRSAHRGHERITQVRKDLVDVKTDLTRRLSEHELSPRFDTTLVSPEAIAGLQTGNYLVVPVTLHTGATTNVTVTRRDLSLTIGPLRRTPEGRDEALEFPLNVRVASIIAKAGREGRIGSVVEPVVRQADAA
jgi:hypothetical protein